MYQVIDQLEENAVIAEYPTARKALNATRRIEPIPEGKPLGYRSITGETRDWRYLVRRRQERGRGVYLYEKSPAVAMGAF